MSDGYKTKVYGISYDGQRRLIVAALSQKEAALLLRLPLSYVRKYAAETHNIVECGVALNKPGTVFTKPLNDSLAPFEELQRGIS